MTNQRKSLLFVLLVASIVSLTATCVRSQTLAARLEWVFATTTCSSNGDTRIVWPDRVEVMYEC